jgi:MFS family permease
VSQTTLPAPTGLRSRLPFDLDALTDPPVRRFFGGTLLGALGLGLVLPFFMIYCVDVRHFQPWQGTAILATEAVLGLVIAPYYGTLVDRYGPSWILAISIPLMSLSLVGIAFVTTPLELLGIAVFNAVVGAGMWSAFSTLMARMVPEEHRADAFGINFLLLNLGIGVGVVISGVYANVHELHTFQVLYVCAGLLTLCQAGVWLTLWSHGRPVAQHEHERERGGWREVLADRRMLRFLVGGTVMMLCGYGSIEAGLPLFVHNVAHLSTHVVGLMFVFNTLTIVLGQVFALGAIRGRSRSLVLGVVGLCWGASWLFATASVYVGTVAAVVGLCVGQVIFATGETLYQPVAPALVNDLAPEHLRGRYNSLMGMLWGLSGAAGQLLAGLFLTVHLGVAWTVVVGIGAVLGGLALTTLRAVLTPEQDGRAAGA